MSDEPLRRRSGLGRGLSALLGEIEKEQPVATAEPRAHGVALMPVGSLRPHPNQPRRHFAAEALDELARSIAARGVLQPIIVRPAGGGLYEIVAGERRWRAAQQARIHEVPVVVRDVSDADTFEIAIIENVQRADLNAIEEADAYRRLVREFGHSVEDVGRLVSKSRSHVANLLRLLDLPEAVRSHVVSGALSMSHARAIASAPDPAALAEEVIQSELSVRATETLARAAKPAGPRTGSPRPAARTRPRETDADLVALEARLSDQLGLKVEIRHDGPNGAVSISYASLEQLDMICQRLSGEPI